jgi:uncharacterized protein (TIGR03437 family)
VNLTRILAILVSAGLLLPAGAPPFQPALGSPFPAGNGPAAVAVGDFDGDSNLDLAIADTTGNTVTVLLGSLTGSFSLAPNTTPISISIASPSAVVAADFDGDGKLDLAVASLSSGVVTILFGNGTGNFPTRSVATSGSGPAAIVTADFNLDHKADLAIVYPSAAANNVAVLLGNGNGTFTAPYTASAGNYPVALAVGNFGGFPGLAVANEIDGTVTVLAGNGASGGSQFTLTTVATVPVTSNQTVGAQKPFPVSVAVADLNGDGLPDLVTANQGTGNVSVLFGKPSSVFALPPAGPIPGFAQPVSVLAADFSGDGIPDLAVLNYASGSVSLLLGTPAGTLQTPVTVSLTGAPSPTAMAGGDFNGDGLPDLAILDTGANNVSVLLNGAVRGLVMLSSASGVPLAAPGSLVSIYGSNLASGTNSAGTGTLPTTLGGASVTITYSNNAHEVLPLFYAAPGQINALMPPDAVPGQATFSVASASGTQTGSVTIQPVAPAIFAANQNGKGVAWAQFVTPNFQVANAFQCPSGGPGTCIPVPLSVGSGGSYLVLYGTGLYIAANNPNITVKVIIGTQTLTPAYVGPSPNSGEDQINVQLPPALQGAGLAPVILMVASTNPLATQYSNAVTVFLQ